MNWTAPGWFVLLTVMLGAGSAIVTWIVLRITHAPKIPADKAAARDELELAVRRVINNNMLLMESCRDLADLCHRLPEEYRPIAEHTLRFAKLMEEATYAEGASERIFPRPLFNADTTTPVPELRPPRHLPAPLEQAADGVAQGELAPPREQMHRQGHWVAGQLIQ